MKGKLKIPAYKPTHSIEEQLYACTMRVQSTTYDVRNNNQIWNKLKSLCQSHNLVLTKVRNLNLRAINIVRLSEPLWSQHIEPLIKELLVNSVLNT